MLRVPVNTVAQRICVTLHLQAGTCFWLSLSLYFYCLFFVVLFCFLSWLQFSKQKESILIPIFIYDKSFLFFLTPIRLWDAVGLQDGGRPVLTSAFPGLLSEPGELFCLIFRRWQRVGQYMTELFPTSSSDGREDRQTFCKILEQSDANKDLKTLFSDIFYLDVQ